MSVSPILSKTIHDNVAQQRKIAKSVIEEKEKRANAFEKYKKIKAEYEDQVFEYNQLIRKIKNLEEIKPRQIASIQRLVKECEELQCRTDDILWQQKKAQMIVDKELLHYQKYSKLIEERENEEKEVILKQSKLTANELLNQKVELSALKESRDLLVQKLQETTALVAEMKETYTAYMNEIASLPNKNTALQLRQQNQIKKKEEEKAEARKKLSMLQERLKFVASQKK